MLGVRGVKYFLFYADRGAINQGAWVVAPGGAARGGAGRADGRGGGG